MIVVRITPAQRQRPDFWAGLRRRVLTIIHSSVVHAGDLIDLELRLFEDQPPLLVGGMVVSCEKRHIDNRDIFRVNCLLDRLSEEVALELDQHIAAHGGPDLTPSEQSADPPVSRAADTAPPPRSSASGFRAVADALVAERTRLVEAEREIASLKSYVQSLENQLLDVRLAPAMQDPLASEHTPAYGTPMVDLGAAEVTSSEREAHAATVRQLEETRSRLQVIEAGAVGTHQTLRHQVEELSHRLNGAEAEVEKVRAQAEAERGAFSAKLQALEQALSSAKEATLAVAKEAATKAERAAGERIKALEEQLAAASEAATVAGREATDRLKALEEKLAVAAREATEREKALDEKLTAANEAAAREKALEEKLAAAGAAFERSQGLEEKAAAALEAQRMLEEKLVAQGEAAQSAERQSAEKLKHLEEQLALATTGVLAAEKEAAEGQKKLAALERADERAKSLETELEALKASSLAAQAELSAKVADTEQKLALLRGDESEATAAAEKAAARVRELEQALAAAEQALEAEGVKAASEGARANAEKAAFAVQEERLKVLEEERAALARRLAALESDAATGRKVADDELEAVRASGRAAKEAAEARQRALETELSGLAARVASAPRALAPASAPSPAAPMPPPPDPARDELEARVKTAEARAAEVTTERDALAAKKTELERELAAKAIQPPRSVGFALQAAGEPETKESSAAVRWLVSLLVCGGLAAAAVAWLTRAH